MQPLRGRASYGITEKLTNTYASPSVRGCIIRKMSSRNVLFQWRRFHDRPAWQRWPVKWLVLGFVVLGVLFPLPGRLWRHIQHARNSETLILPDHPAVAPVLAEYEAYLHEAQPVDELDFLAVTEAFVYRRVPYSYDWENWGVVEYLPTAVEVIERGTEDCDGRAVLAATLLRARGYDANLAADPRHMWVRTPQGDLMNPLGEPVFRQTDEGVEVDWLRLIDSGPMAFGIAIFPIWRELVIIVAAWLLLMHPGQQAWQRVLSLILGIAALFLMRYAGQNPVQPIYSLIYCSIGLVLAAVAVSWLRLGSDRDQPRGAGDETMEPSGV